MKGGLGLIIDVQSLWMSKDSSQSFLKVTLSAWSSTCWSHLGFVSLLVMKPLTSVIQLSPSLKIKENGITQIKLKTFWSIFDSVYVARFILLNKRSTRNIWSILRRFDVCLLWWDLTSFFRWVCKARDNGSSWWQGNACSMPRPPNVPLSNSELDYTWCLLVLKTIVGLVFRPLSAGPALGCMVP